MNYDLIIPALKEDALKVLNNLEYFDRYINYRNIVFIGNEEVKKMIDDIKNDKIKFINEDSVVKNMNYKAIKDLLISRGGNSKRAGWYLQQFLKLGYSYICKDEY